MTETIDRDPPPGRRTAHAHRVATRTGSGREGINALLHAVELGVRPVAMCRVGGGGALELPARPQPSVIYVMGGAATIANADGAVTVGDHDLVVLPPARSGRIIAPPVPTERAMAGTDGPPSTTLASGREMRAVDVCAEPPSFAGICGEIEPNATAGALLFANQSAPFRYPLAEFGPVHVKCVEMVRAMGHAYADDRAAAASLLRDALLTLLSEAIAAGQLSGAWSRGLGDPRIARALAAMLDDLEHEHGLAGLARHAGMSRSTFALRFREAMGATPLEFLRELRLQRGAQLLAAGRPVKVAAGEVGFASRSHFSRAFARRFGIAPSDWSGRARLRATA